MLGLLGALDYDSDEEVARIETARTAAAAVNKKRTVDEEQLDGSSSSSESDGCREFDEMTVSLQAFAGRQRHVPLLPVPDHRRVREES